MTCRLSKFFLAVTIVLCGFTLGAGGACPGQSGDLSRAMDDINEEIEATGSGTLEGDGTIENAEEGFIPPDPALGGTPETPPQTTTPIPSDGPDKVRARAEHQGDLAVKDGGSGTGDSDEESPEPCYKEFCWELPFGVERCNMQEVPCPPDTFDQSESKR